LRMRSSNRQQIVRIIQTVHMILIFLQWPARQNIREGQEENVSG
jgi:hypothetical protein